MTLIPFNHNMFKLYLIHFVSSFSDVRKVIKGYDSVIAEKESKIIFKISLSQ